MDNYYTLCLSFLLASCVSALQAATVTSVQSGPWIDVATWDCTCIPALTDDVIVAAGHDVGITGTVTVDGSLVVNGTVGLSGVLTGTGIKTIASGGILNDAGTIGGTGDIIVSSGGTLVLNGNAGTSEISTTVRNHGTTNWNNGSINYYCADGQFVNEASGSLNILGTPSPRYWSRASLQNFGTINKSSSAEVRFENTGCPGPATTFNNSGTVNISAGHLLLSHNGTHSGTFNNSGTLTFSGFQTLTTSGNVTGTGTFNITGITAIDVPYTFACSSVNLTGTLNGSGSKTISLGCTLNNAGTIDGTGELVVSSGGTLELNGNAGTSEISTTVRNHGTTNWNNGSINYYCADGQFVNEASGSLNILGTPSPRYWSRISLQNFGTINKSSGAEVRFENTGCPGFPYPFDNLGTMNIAVGTLIISSFNFTNTGLLMGSGSISFSGGFVQNGSISPGNSPGILTLSQLPGGTTTTYIEMQGSTTPGADYDQIVVNGAGTISGTLDINFLNNYEPTIGGEFIIMTCTGGCSGSFSNIVHPGNNPNAWQIDMTNPNQVKLVLVQALPVELVSLTAKALNENTSQLQWETASELDNDGFFIEKSTDGRSFEDIGFVQGAGTSHQMKTYHYQDEAFRQDAYYRLRQVDFDGKSSYSKIVFLKHGGSSEQGIQVYPNPAGDRIAIKSKSTPTPDYAAKMTIENGMGQVVSSLNASPETGWLDIDISHLMPGIYYLKMDSGGVVRFVKQ